MGLLSKLPGFSEPDKHSLHFLNIAQFMGALNDNIFKFVIAFLLIDIKGPAHASSIMWKAGLVFVVPFLLFSSTAGALADRFSKQKLLQTIKGIEILTMTLAMLAFGMKSVWASYSLLFLLSTHSAMFGPSKYAIISELVTKEQVASANGLITSFTYLAIIVGTFLASFITKISNHNFVIVAAFCLLIAIIGFLSTFGIKKTPPQGGPKHLNLLFVREIYRTLCFCKTRKHLLLAVTCSAYFLFIGSFVQLNIIPYAIHALSLSDVAGGYLFLSTALGIVFGSYLGGKISRKRVDLGLSCFSGLAIAIFLFFLWIFSSYLNTVIIFLVLLGIFGGLFIVPFDSFVQLFSPPEKRGQVIAANNFLSFCGVFFASLALYLYSEVFNLSPEGGFAVTGILTLVLALGMISRLSDLSLPFLTRTLLYPFSPVVAEGVEVIEKSPDATFILRNATWKKALLLLTVAPQLHLVVQKKSKRRFPWFNRLFYSLHLVSREKMVSYAAALSHKKLIPCMFAEEGSPDFHGVYIDVHPASRETKITFSKT
jgi:acyl-[acyl-carrier-protein]-phospholipid O-acyltransferase / long-chain-fatty-acid--[acyl-carrier-protein] ligase